MFYAIMKKMCFSEFVRDDSISEDVFNVYNDSLPETRKMFKKYF